MFTLHLNNFFLLLWMEQNSFRSVHTFKYSKNGQQLSRVEFLKKY